MNKLPRLDHLTRVTGLIALLLLLLTACTPTVNVDGTTPGSSQGLLRVHFIDVGQADAILVQAPTGENLLIDAGNNEDGDLVLGYLREQGITRLDHVIGTHPHEDHIGGLDTVIKGMTVGKVYLPDISANTKTFEDVLLAVQSKGLKVTRAKAGVPLNMGEAVQALMLAPVGDEYGETNDYSAVVRIIYDNISFLLTGDAEEPSEQDMLQSGANLLATVLKVGHHGGATSSSPAFLQSVNPQYAVISVGKDNSYGHPHAELLERLYATGATIYRTDQFGTVVAETDGRTMEFNKPATAEYQVVIQSVDLSGEVVTIVNQGSVLTDLSGWELVSVVGDQRFTFPDGTQLAAGAKLQVRSGGKAEPGPGAIVWTKSNIWNNSGDPAMLYDAGGRLVHRLP